MEIYLICEGCDMPLESTAGIDRAGELIEISVLMCKNCLSHIKEDAQAGLMNIEKKIKEIGA